MVAEGEVSDGALEEIAYLARSENRVQVLRALTETVTDAGQPAHSLPLRELREVTGTSRSTLSRILTEFEERGWARENEDGEYEVTPLGEHVAAEFDPLVESMETIEEFGETVGLVPVTELTAEPWEGIRIGHRHFADATILGPDWDPGEVERYYAETLEEADTWRWVVYTGPTKSLPVVRRASEVARPRFRSGELDGEGVFAGNIVDRFLGVRDFGPKREDLELENVRIHRYDDHLPCNIWVADDTVILENGQTEGIDPGTLLVTENEVVREWALDLVERYVERAREVQPEDFHD